MVTCAKPSVRVRACENGILYFMYRVTRDYYLCLCMLHCDIQEYVKLLPNNGKLRKKKDKYVLKNMLFYFIRNVHAYAILRTKVRTRLYKRFSIHRQYRSVNLISSCEWNYYDVARNFVFLSSP